MQAENARSSDLSPHGIRLQALGSLILHGASRPVGLRGLELLILLMIKPDGWYPDGLAEALYGKLSLSCLKAAISRLRHELGLSITRPPYLLVNKIPADFLELEDCLARGDFWKALELYKGPLAPQSQAPGIIEHRNYLEEALKNTLLKQEDDLELLVNLATHFPDDLALLEEVLERLPDDHRSRPFLLARMDLLRGEFYA